MVEAIVSMVMGKLCDAVVQEVLLLHGVDDQVDVMKRELGRIQCFLRDADNKRRRNERMNHWIGEVRDVAHRIEDAIDTFLVEVDGIDVDRGRPKKLGCCTSLIACGKKPMELPARYRLGKEIKKIEKLILEIAESTSRYGINKLEDCVAEEVRRPVRPIIIPDSDDTDVVGFEADIKNIIQLLVDPSINRRAIISIVGTGGLGKTTLAQKVYKSFVDKAHFEFRAWLSISQEFKLFDLLKKIINKLPDVNSNENDDEENMIEKIHRSLQGKKYLVVLDDVWKEDLWIQLERAFPNVSNGSRVLMTTRNEIVALAASPEPKPYKLKFLSDAEGEKLLLKKAFPYQDPKNPYPADLLDLAKHLAKQCGGLPLALVVLGGLLSMRTTREEWIKVDHTMDWHDKGKRCMEILTSSYDDLPSYLKSCFMMFACFPEDFEIPLDAVIKIWIAEGFISEKTGITMEDTAESYLEELVQRCMVQTIEIENHVQKERYLRIHDLLRDVAIHEAMEESNLTIFAKEGVRPKTKGPSRHATLQNSNLDPMAHTGPNLRSILCFNNSEFHPDYSGFRLLKVLSFMHVRFSHGAKLYWLKELIHLRYLGFIGCSVRLELPHDIAHCKNLQTLHIIGNNSYLDIPESLWSIKALRHVIIKLKLPFNLGIEPPARVELTNLLTLEGVKVPESWMTRLPRLTSLRTLLLYNEDTGIPWDVIANLLCELNHLISLTLTGTNFTGDILDTTKFRSYEKIQLLGLYGSWATSVALDAGMFPLHITELVLVHSNFEQDPMLELNKLVSLRILVMGFDSYHGNQMTCLAGGFRGLQQLTIYYLRELEELKIEENSMRMLNKLKLGLCMKMRMLPDLQHVPTLRKLELNCMPDHINSRVQNEDHQKIKHVPLIEIRDK